jgi:hypothetical protein
MTSVFLVVCDYSSDKTIVSGRLESKMLLGNITESYYEERSDQFRWCRIPLFALGNRSSLKYYIPAQVKTDGKCYTEPDQKSGDMCSDGKEPKMNRLFLQDIIVRNEEQGNIETGIETTASRITESLQWHHLLEQRVEQVHRVEDQFTDMLVQLSHQWRRR